MSADGGPAFPTTKPLESWDDPNGGMSLRDYFAAKALEGQLAAFAHPQNGKASIDAAMQAGVLPKRRVADAAYEYADAMLAARAA